MMLMKLRGKARYFIGVSFVLNNLANFKLQTISDIIRNNQYQTHLLKPHQKTPNRIRTQQNKLDKQRWAIFNYVAN
jgi:hypothetical protein